jgi:CheY-like chemotaxis protein
MQTKTILLIEDNKSDISLTRRAMQRNHIVNELIVLEDGLEAIEYLMGIGSYANRDVNLQPTLILLDLKLPTMDGIEVLRHIRNNEQTHRIPVVVLTSSKEDPDLAACYDLGANSYIRKPVDFIQFSKVICDLGLYWLVINESPPPVLKD